MLIFHQITMFFGGKCARNEKLDMKWIEIALEYCNFTLISEKRHWLMAMKIL